MTWRMMSKRSIRNLQFGLLAVSTVWGLDYFLPPTEDGRALSYFENHAYLPIQVWGAIMVLAGSVGLICETFLARNEIRWHRLWLGPWIAHALFGGIFSALALGAFLSILEVPGYAGFRTTALWTFIAVVHFAYARRLDKPEPTVLIRGRKAVSE